MQGNNNDHLVTTTSKHQNITMAPRTRGVIEEPQNDSKIQEDDSSVEHVFVQLAKKHWLKPTTSKKVATTKVKIKPDVLKKEIWDVLEAEDFQFQSLLLLENLQLLER